MPFIKRYDTLACEVLTSEEEVIVLNNENEKDENKVKENKKNEEYDIKANEVAELIIFT